MSDVSAVEPFKQELQELDCELLTLDLLYNCDETGLCFRMLPSKTLASRSEREASAMKKQKERVTLNAQTSFDGNWQGSESSLL